MTKARFNLKEGFGIMPTACPSLVETFGIMPVARFNLKEGFGINNTKLVFKNKNLLSLFYSLYSILFRF
jgi:hypothetical protein